MPTPTQSHRQEPAICSPTLSGDAFLSQLEHDWYTKSLRKGASSSLSIFVRRLALTELSPLFDPGFSPSVPTNALTDNLSQIWQDTNPPLFTWGLPLPEDPMSFTWAEDMVEHCSTFDTTHQIFTERTHTLAPSFSGSRTPVLTPSVPKQAQEFSIDISPYDTHPDTHGELFDALQCVTEEIVTKVKASLQAAPPHHPTRRTWTPDLERDCHRFFCPQNLLQLTADYWNTWYIHWPVVHRATFDVCTAPPALVASMMLLGACYSSDDNTKQAARNWADSVELMVFTDEYFGSATTYSTLNGACLERRLRALQAAHAVCIYQSFEGTDMAARRTRRCRFNEVVAVCLRITPSTLSTIALLMSADGARAWFSKRQTRRSGEFDPGYVRLEGFCSQRRICQV